LGDICTWLYVLIPCHVVYVTELPSFIDSTSTTFQPFFLDFQKVHSLATQFFIRMWGESGAVLADFPRIAALVRSQ
jgi:hypothetical protein